MTKRPSKLADPPEPDDAARDVTDKGDQLEVAGAVASAMGAATAARGTTAARGGRYEVGGTRWAVGGATVDVTNEDDRPKLADHA